jgi:hypothetical protein
MLFFLGSIAAIAGIAAMLYGAFLVYRGYFTDNAKIELHNIKLDAPVGIVVFLCGLGALAWIYSKGLESQTDQLVKERDRYKTELDSAKNDLSDTKKERDTQVSILKQSQIDADTEKKRADRLASDLTKETAERREAQQFASDTWRANDRLALSEAQRAEFDRFGQGVLALNNDLTVLRIRATPWPTLSGRKAVATFEIYRKDFDTDATRPRGAGLFQFNLEQYTLEGESSRGMTEELAQGISKMICDAAYRAIANGVSPREAFAQIPSLARYEGDAQRVREVADLQYVLVRLKLLAADALVLVRGYADGEQGPWQRPLNPEFKDIQLHESANPNAKPADYALEFRQDLTHVVLGRSSTGYAKYGNEDLPDLRAKATVQIVTSLLKSCSPPTNDPTGKIGVEILDGAIYQGTSAPDRKARVYLLIFLKEG